MYRLAFCMLACLSLLLMDAVFRARLNWYPHYERSMLLRMSGVQEAVILPAKTVAGQKKPVSNKRIKRGGTARRTVKAYR